MTPRLFYCYVLFVRDRIVITPHPLKAMNNLFFVCLLGIWTFGFGAGIAAVSKVESKAQLIVDSRVAQYCEAGLLEFCDR
ncbi:hypothetical protein [Synechococcus sp. SYN20]|uniref:hypothetical protein n=1 Tax=Synechococcus sp. SYN20 TaxID=1050714 RepID=UPI001648AFA5|nr:hypothetical protein [Synechococcus sp. SYN20]